jgi:hypothetical protein
MARAIAIAKIVAGVIHDSRPRDCAFAISRKVIVESVRYFLNGSDSERRESFWSLQF